MTIKGRLLSSVSDAKATDGVIFCTWPCDRDLWPFDREQLAYMAGQVLNPVTKFEDLMPIRSWVE